MFFVAVFPRYDKDVMNLYSKSLKYEQPEGSLVT